MNTFKNVIATVPENSSRFNALVKLCKDHKVIPFVGAGLSIPPFSTWGESLKAIAKDTGIYQDICYLISENLFETAADRIFTYLEGAVYRERFIQIFNLPDEKKVSFSPSIEILPDLFHGFVITTNYDLILETVYQKEHPFIDSITPTNYDLDSIMQSARLNDHHYLIKLHGNITNPQSCVLTSQDYKKYYDDNPNFLDALRLLFTSSTLLFLGCSLTGKDRYLTERFKILSHENISEKIIKQDYAFLPLPDYYSTNTDRFDSWKAELSRHGILPIWYPNGQYDCVEVLLNELLSQCGFPKTKKYRYNSSSVAIRDAIQSHNNNESAPSPMKLIGYDPHLYVSPHYSKDTYVITNRESDDIISQINEYLRDRKNVILVADPGCGKSYITYTAFKEMDEATSGQAIFISLRNYTKKRIGKNFFKSELHLSNDAISVLSEQYPQFYFYLDGADEWHPQSSTYSPVDSIQNLFKSIKYPFLCSMRRDFFNSNNIAQCLSSNFIVLFVHGWDENTFNLYCNRVIRNDILRNRFISTIQNCDTFWQIKGNEKIYPPLLSALAAHTANDQEFDSTRSAVVDIMQNVTMSCIDNTAKKLNKYLTEQNRNTILFTLFKISSIYFEIISKGINVVTLYEIKRKLGITESEWDDVLPYINAFFYIEVVHNGETIYPMHNYIVMYFKAREVVYSLLNDSNITYTTLLMSSDVNRIIRSVMLRLNENELNLIFDKYDTLYKMASDANERSIVLYHLLDLVVANRRLFAAKVTSYLIELIDENEGSNSIIPIYSLLTQMGNMEYEQQYYHRIMEDEGFAYANRSVYLVYQHDRAGMNFNYQDELDNTEWERCAKAFVEHFNSHEIRQAYIRRCDFATILSFLKCGKQPYPFLLSFFSNMSLDSISHSTFTPDYQKNLNRYPKITQKEIGSDLTRLCCEILSYRLDPMGDL